ncbi:MAG: hypothetical protein L0332_09115 [Chloroflexi bacterium]|nr:hypothetical protein [Chloroflexota bacterium]MCI0574680.1 hypothetical protein [Chloroflexota bacterium]MCI0647427.1 hypothetical protein [Chloroflexota bacterium]MCI0726865.1 hypothetical protein [Chloroflexota bacterium]
MQMQQQYGNAYVQRLLGQAPGLVQRQPLPDVAGQPLAAITLDDPASVMVNGLIHVETELLPAGEKPGQFPGYQERLQAYALAWSQNNICAVVTDQEGRYHALKTDWPGRSSQVSAQIEPFVHPYARLSWVNLPGKQELFSENGNSWAERVDRVQGWYQSWQLKAVPNSFKTNFPGQNFQEHLQREFVSLLAGALDISPSLIYVAQKEGDRDPTALITFDLWMSDAQGMGGIKGALPSDETTEVKEPTVAIGPRAFNRDSYKYILGTVIHETQHFSHATIGNELLLRWRKSGSRLSFEKWLRNELGRRRISREEFDLVLEMIHDDEDASETLSYLEAFLAIYHRLPVSGNANRFHELDTMVEYWIRAGHEINDSSIRRLAAYYRVLDEEHRQDFAEHARQAQGAADELNKLFWDRVVKEVL